jgi:mRNA interferase MazF
MKQGSIILIDLNPVLGHEQANKRPCLVLQTDMVHVLGGTTIVAPITSKEKKHPLQIKLDQRTKTQGVILCSQIRAIALNARNAVFLEMVPKDILEECCDIVQQLVSPSN